MTPTLRAAIDLFNKGSYLASHELFEELWEETEGEDADFFKGLIQAAICMHHLGEGNVEGAAPLYRGHRRYLAGYRPTRHGIDVSSFLASMERCARPQLSGTVPEDSEKPTLETV